MGRPQTKTPAITDNTTAQGLMNDTMTSNKSKKYDLRCNWLKCREAQNQFDLIWKKDQIIEQTFIQRITPSKFILNKGVTMYWPRQHRGTIMYLQGCA